MEFGVAVLGARLIVVVGHNHCGAVENAMNGTSGLPEDLQNILDTIRPGVEDADDYDAGVEANVRRNMETLRANGVVSDTDGTVVVGAVYDITTGEVRFFD
jgi:carbonic anhydrase